MFFQFNNLRTLKAVLAYRYFCLFHLPISSYTSDVKIEITLRECSRIIARLKSRRGHFGNTNLLAGGQSERIYMARPANQQRLRPIMQLFLLLLLLLLSLPLVAALGPLCGWLACQINWLPRHCRAAAGVARCRLPYQIWQPLGADWKRRLCVSWSESEVHSKRADWRFTANFAANIGTMDC